MYFWKFWRDTRWHFLGYLTALCALAIASVLLRVNEYFGKGAWAAFRGGSPDRVEAVWHDVPGAIAGGGWLIVLLAGLTLGASGVGDECKRATLEFLLTRPRSRRYFFWTGWLFGAGELLVMIALSVLVALGMLVYTTRSFVSWRITGLVPALFLVGLVFFSLSYTLTTFLRDGKNGSGLAFLLLLLYWGLGGLAYWKWKIQLPYVLSMLWPVMRPADPFPYLPVAGWLLFALVLPLLAAWRFERWDV